MKISNGVPEPEVWRGIRKDTANLLQTNHAAAALKKALDALQTNEARVLKLRLGITNPEE